MSEHELLRECMEFIGKLDPNLVNGDGPSLYARCQTHFAPCPRRNSCEPILMGESKCEDCPDQPDAKYSRTVAKAPEWANYAEEGNNLPEKRQPEVALGMKLKAYIREQTPGQCKMLSMGDECPCMLCAVDDLVVALSALRPALRPLSEWHEDFGFVTWWKFPIDEPAWIGSPLCVNWPGYHTHWTPHPTPPDLGR